ncbi:cucumisin-like [Magnolia sinica]|uniref:cucumisin-like n=1 Tax=Magnolia sinica TaxID=86752 RepID=UPI00265B6B6D|nr:cucumisin-like [Magnolia sinica]
MANFRSLIYPLLLAAIAFTCHCQERKVYVVYMGNLPKEGVSVASHHTMLEDVLGSSSKAKESLVYSYGKSFNGFAAKLSEEEAAMFSEMEGVVSILPNTKLQLHTTRSWDFTGLPQNYLNLPHEGDVIVGVLDTGVWPESESFSDVGFGAPPAKWKGICQTVDNFTCNNKLIGARYYNSDNYYDDTDFKSPRDSEGHGTHTSSTAAGRAVPASYHGLAKGIARGAVPQARIAVYKVCWSSGCGLADILAAFDDAVADGVDIISVSLGSGYPSPYFHDPIAIGSFHAMKYGILTSNSAGNSGPYPVSVSNYAPWTLTVAASTIDRKFVSQVALGNGQTFTGNAINPFELNGTSYPMIYGGSAPNVSAGANADISRSCDTGSLNSYKVRGKIVLCDYIYDGSGVIEAEGLGNIMADYRYSDFAFSYPLPSTLLSIEDGAKVLDYIQSTDNPIGTILAGETWKDVSAPRVISFSSRGPNPITPDILKPDLTAPGVDILAAWSPVAPPSIYYADTTSVKYNIISGTSMSCPHASGAAAFVKAAYPNWSPAAIKSALMTTAYVMDARKNEDAEFAYGSGHINPMAAINPGLVYNATEQDYVEFLCNSGYNTTTLRIVTGDSSTCSGNSTGNAWDLNYPSFALSIPDGQSIRGTFHRTVTNVGSPNSTYYATVYAPSFQVSVEPSVLSFTSMGETKSFTVKVSGGVIAQQPIISGYIAWKDGVHVVRSPVVVYTVLPDGPVSINNAHEGPSMRHRNGIFGRI